MHDHYGGSNQKWTREAAAAGSLHPSAAEFVTVARPAAGGGDGTWRLQAVFDPTATGPPAASSTAVAVAGCRQGWVVSRARLVITCPRAGGVYVVLMALPAGAPNDEFTPVSPGATSRGR